MVDVEKVKAGLKCCNHKLANGRIDPNCEECPYKAKIGTCLTLEGLLNDVGAVIEAQEKHINELHDGIVRLRDAMEEVRKHG